MPHKVAQQMQQLAHMASCGWRGEIIRDIHKGYLGMINMQLRKNKSCAT